MNSPDPLSERRRAGMISALLVVATFLAYSSVRHFEFNNYDDLLYVTGNDIVKRGVTWGGIVTAFTQPMAANWHPLTMISHMLDVELFGLKSGAHHLVNLAFHIANSVLLFWLFVKTTRTLWPSAVVAFLFAVHPVHVESVAWVAQRKDVLSGFFGLLTIWAYIGYAARGGALRYLAVLIFFALGLLAKPILITLPILLLLLDYWPLARIPSLTSSQTAYPQQRLARLVLEKVPLLLLALICGLLTVWAQSKFGAVGSLQRFSPGERIGNALVSYSRYLAKTVWPSDLSFLYPHPGAWPWPIVLGAVVLLALITTVTVVFARRRPYLVAGWLWFLVALTPVIGLVQAGEQAMADRYMYLPLIGLGIMIAWGIRDVATQNPEKRFMPWVAGLVAAALVLTTRAQASHWRSSETLYTHALRLNGSNATAHQLLARTLRERGDNANAVKHYFEALRIRPTDETSHYNVGILFTEIGALTQATNHLGMALHLNPTNLGARFHLGRAFTMLGDNKSAASNYSIVLQNAPHDYYTKIQLGHVYLRDNDVEGALRLFEEAVRQAPTSAVAYHASGTALLKSGKTDEAIDQLRQALQFDPKYASAHRHLGQALAGQGKPQEALKEYREAIRFAPDFAEAWNDLAWLLATHPEEAVRNGSEAVRVATRACELSGYQQPIPLMTLASAYAENRQFDDAIKTAELATRLAEQSGQNELVSRYRQQLATYRERHPWREPPQPR